MGSDALHRWKRLLFRRRHGALIDALRRSNECLGFDDSPYTREEIDHIRMVNWRLLREYDPKAETDRMVA